MKLAGIISTAALSLLLATAAAPLYAQEQHEEQKDQQEQKDKPAKPEEKKAQPEEKKAQGAKPKQEEKTTQQHEQQAKSGQQSQRGRIPDDKFQANFGREHTFHVSQGDYRNRRFQYGGYAFGFVGVWPANWLYTQEVFVVDIDGVYYLCNPVYPGVNIALSFAL